jgi:hypothetical protein
MPYGIARVAFHHNAMYSNCDRGVWALLMQGCPLVLVSKATAWAAGGEETGVKKEAAPMVFKGC